jgi:hypothetical protein
MVEVTGLEDWQQARLIPVAGIRGLVILSPVLGAS